MGSGWLGHFLPGKTRRADPAFPARSAWRRSLCLRSEGPSARRSLQRQERDSAAGRREEGGREARGTKKPKRSLQAANKRPRSRSKPIAIDVAGYSPSPDGKWLAVWAKDPETPGEKKQKDAKADAVWVNHEEHLTRLYLAALKPDGSLDGALKPVGVEPDVQRAIWTQAADRLLVITEKPNDASDLGPANAAWIVDAASPDKPTRLSAIPATVGGAAWSADGSDIVFAAQTPEDAPPGYDELFALPRQTSGTPVVPLLARIRRPVECVGGLLPAGWRPGGAGRGWHALHGRPAGARWQRSAETSRPRSSRDYRPQHQSQADRLGVAGRERRPAGEAVFCPTAWATHAPRSRSRNWLRPTSAPSSLNS